MISGNQWTPEELAAVKMRVQPIVTYDELKVVDDILSNGSIYWTGEDIRNRLFEAGFRVVKIEKSAA